MEKPYQKIIDFWEGNPDIDPQVCKANGVIGMIPRLNDMQGGHHMDERFNENWAMALEFDVQSIYFVYNPWKNGRENYDWMMAHLPCNFGKRRIFIDLEVEGYAGYSPSTYGTEVIDFMARVRQNFPATRYSGGGYSQIMDKWPRDEDYWWAAYPNALLNVTSWAKYDLVVSQLNYTAFTRLCHGTPRMWQTNGKGVRLEGFGNHEVDVNIFPGTKDDAIAWFACEPVVPEPVNEYQEILRQLAVIQGNLQELLAR